MYLLGFDDLKPYKKFNNIINIVTFRTKTNKIKKGECEIRQDVTLSSQ